MCSPLSPLLLAAERRQRNQVSAISAVAEKPTVYYTVYSKNKEIKIYTEKISTKMVIGYTDGYTARIFCIPDFPDKFRYIRYAEKSFENNVSQCYGLFDSTGSYWTGMRLRYTRLRGRLYCRIYWILYCILSISRNVCINQYKVVISIYAVYLSGYTSILIYTH